MEIKVSYFESVKNPAKKRDVDLLRFLNTDYFKDTIERIQAGEKELKQTLPAISPHARFESKRGLEESHEMSGVLFVDIDGKEQTIPAQQIKEMFMSFQETIAVRLSSSGEGVHAFIYIGDNDLEQSYDTMKYLMEKVGVKIDKCKDVSRLCFASYDEAVYINRYPKQLKVIKPEVTTPPAQDYGEFEYKGDDPQSDFYKYCKSFEVDFAEGQRNHWVFHKACQAKDKFGLSQMQAETVLTAWMMKGFSRSEIESAVRSAYKS